MSERIGLRILAVGEKSRTREPRREMTQNGGLVDHPETGYGLPLLEHFKNRFNQRNPCGFECTHAEEPPAARVPGMPGTPHHFLDLCARTWKNRFRLREFLLQIEFRDESLSGKLVRGNMRQERTRIDVDGVPSRRLDDGHSSSRDVFSKIARGTDPIVQIVFVQYFFQADGNRVEVASRKPAVCRNPSVRIRRFSSTWARAASLVARNPRCWRGRLSWRTSCSRRHKKHLLRDCLNRFVRITVFTQLDEIGVFRKAAGIDVQRDPVLRRDCLTSRIFDIETG